MTEALAILAGAGAIALAVIGAVIMWGHKQIVVEAPPPRPAPEPEPPRIRFEDVSERIKAAIIERKDSLNIDEDLSLIDGLLNLPLADSISHNLGSVIPTVGLVGAESGRLHLFAVYALLPELHPAASAHQADCTPTQLV